MTHLTRASAPSDDDNMSAVTVSMKWQTSVAEAVKLIPMVQINPWTFSVQNGLISKKQNKKNKNIYKSYKNEY